MVKLSDGIKFLKREDVVSGQKITIISEGCWVESTKYTYPDGKFRKDFYLDVQKGTDKYRLRTNATNRKALMKAYGSETQLWIGRIVQIDIVKVMVSGDLVDTMMLVPTKELGDTSKVDPNADKPTPEEIAWEE